MRACIRACACVRVILNVTPNCLDLYDYKDIHNHLYYHKYPHNQYYYFLLLQT